MRPYERENERPDKPPGERRRPARRGASPDASHDARPDARDDTRLPTISLVRVPHPRIAHLYQRCFEYVEPWQWSPVTELVETGVWFFERRQAPLALKAGAEAKQLSGPATKPANSDSANTKNGA